MSKLNEKDLVQNQEEIINIIDEDEKDEKLLQKKRNKNSNEKEVILCEQNDDVEKIQTKKNFDSIEYENISGRDYLNNKIIELLNTNTDSLLIGDSIIKYCLGNEKINLLTEKGLNILIMINSHLIHHWHIINHSNLRHHIYFIINPHLIHHRYIIHHFHLRYQI